MNDMNDDELNRYSRHILLNEMGVEGQARLQQARVAIIGAGGLGCVVAQTLAAAGIGELTIADDDSVDLTNLQRQVLYDTDSIGKSKVQCAQQRLQQINPLCHVKTLAQRIDASNIKSFINDADMVVDASDNFATRHLINRACVQLQKPLSFGAAIGFDGQATTFDFVQQPAPCYNCIFSEQDEAADVRCSLMGVFAPLVNVVGSVQAGEVLRYIAMPNAPESRADSLINKLLLIDMKSMRFRLVKIVADSQCEVCA